MQPTKEQFIAARKNIKEAQKELDNLLCSCTHKIVNKHNSAFCIICDSWFGWFCDESPDHSCHYFSENGKVKLNDGTLVDIPEDHDVDYENEDECIFCGQPEERK